MDITPAPDLCLGWSYTLAPVLMNACTRMCAQVMGMEALLEWDSSTMQQALDQFHSAGMQQLGRYGGYMVEEQQGYMQAAFCQPSNAVSWADECVQALLHEKWWVGGG